MRGVLLSMLKSLKRDKDGNASLVVAIGIPALIGAAGLGIDTAQWYSWKRELQHATDQAALAGAWALSDSNSKGKYKERAKQDFKANLALTKGAPDPTVALANYKNGNDNSVTVTATFSKTLPFSSFLTGKGVTIQAYSQASFAAGANYSACLISVGDNGTTFSIGGNATVKAACGLAALSCSDDALVIDGSASVTTDSIATCGTANVPSSLDGVVTENASGLKDDFADLSPPTNNTPQEYKCVGKGNKAAAAPIAGTYTDGITVSCTTTFGSGIYVIDGGTLDLTGNFTVTGTNVMFVLKNGAQLKLGGSGNGNVLTLTPMQASQFTALGYSTTLANRYANMLIFEDRTSNPKQDHIINGNSNSLFEGTIYLPASTARVNGTASLDSSCLQISAKKINILGNAYLDTRCSTSQTNSAGSSTAKVNLVA